LETANTTSITIEATIHAPIEKVWAYWTEPQHVTNWNYASEDWHSPHAENDLRPGGKFLYRMEAKDGSFGFDFGGIYNVVKKFEYIEYTIGDGRKVKTNFTRDDDDAIKIVETFEAENINSIEMQRNGWQAILDNFKKYTETN
jgi:uncharacterized protein YndB with AHSA1/START domain